MEVDKPNGTSGEPVKESDVVIQGKLATLDPEEELGTNHQQPAMEPQAAKKPGTILYPYCPHLGEGSEEIPDINTLPLLEPGIKGMPTLLDPEEPQLGSSLENQQLNLSKETQASKMPGNILS